MRIRISYDWLIDWVGVVIDRYCEYIESDAIVVYQQMDFKTVSIDNLKEAP